jgi:beta-glucosidase
VVGENHWQAENRAGTDGEGYDSATLELTGRQEELVRAVVATGTPTIVVLVNGRPLATRWIAAHVPAIIEAWLPGERGGEAVAGVLFGDINPSGRLSITVPRHVGQLPVAYDAMPSKRYWIDKGWGKPYVDLDPAPLFPFGFGLSYTQFAYANLRLTPTTVPQDGQVAVEVDVQNTGSRAGAEVVQLYVNDPIASVSRPPLQLRGFEKVRLEPSERRTVRFVLGPDALEYLDAHLQRVVEPGAFRVMIGRSSRDIILTGGFEVTGR